MDAERYFDVAEEKDGNAFYREKGNTAMQHAAIYATIAQAEQLERIADALRSGEDDATGFGNRSIAAILSNIDFTLNNRP